MKSLLVITWSPKKAVGLNAISSNENLPFYVNEQVFAVFLIIVNTAFQKKCYGFVH